MEIIADIKMKEIKEYLCGMQNSDLIKEITELVKLFPEVKEYYNLKINPEAEREAFAKYKKKITNEFYPDRGFGKLRYSVINKAIADFKKIAKRPENIAELMFLYAELGIEFTSDFGDIDDRFYDNICKAYDRALKYIFVNELQDKYRARAQAAIDNTSFIGWGFQESFEYIFSSYYLEED